MVEAMSPFSVLVVLLIAMAVPTLAGGGNNKPDDGLTYVEQRVTYKEAVAGCRSRNMVRGENNCSCRCVTIIVMENVSIVLVALSFSRSS